jgi:MSHA pilin protein MshB
MRAYYKKAGFTLIEMVIVIVLLGLLAAVALPRFLNVSKDAEKAIVKNTSGSFHTGLVMAKSRWELENKTNKYLDIDNDGRAETRFNVKGFPVGISGDGETALSDIMDKGVAGHDACSQILGNVVDLTGMSVIAADNQGRCKSGDFCAKATGTGDCVYTYRNTKNEFVYRALTGEVLYE